MEVRRQPQPLAVFQGENVQMIRAKSGSLKKAQHEQASAWAHYAGGIERVHFCGEDIEAMKEHIAQEEVDRRVAQALSYQTDIPCFLSRSLQKDPPEIKDFLELDCVEDLNNKGDSPCYDTRLQAMNVEYDESFLEWLEIILQKQKLLKYPFWTSILN